MTSSTTRDTSEGPDFEEQSTTASTLVYDVKEPASGEKTNLLPEKGESSAAPERGCRFVDRYLIPAFIVVVTLWPWIFFLIIRAKGGIKLPPGLASYVVRYPQQFYIVITYISTLNSLAVGYLFGCTVESYGKSLLIGRWRLSLLEVMALLCFKNSVFLGEIFSTRARRPQQNFLKPFSFVALFISGAVLMGTAVLISPANFERTVSLHGTELNFMSEDDECLKWLDAHRISDMCSRRNFAGARYSTCLDGIQVFDALESGLRNVLVHANISQGVLSLRQPKGVLPQGPDGVRGFDTIQASENPFSDSLILRSEPKSKLFFLYASYVPTRKGTLSYDYTLQLQGVQSSINCTYDTTSPIVGLMPVPGESGMLAQYDGTCDPAKGLEPVLDGVQNYVVLNTSKTLSYWACKSPPQSIDSDAAHLVYLRGWDDYEDSVGNITCTVSQLRPAVFSVTHEGSGYFSAEKEEEFNSSSPSRIPYPHFVDHTLVGLGNVVREAQDLDSNLVAESVITMGGNVLNISGGERHEAYLGLYEAMIEGILEYEAMYSRLIYSTLPNPPRSCIRPVEGTASYTALGWRRYGWQYGIFLLPLTIINLTTLIAYPVFTRRWIDDEDVANPTDVRWLLAATLDESGEFIEIESGKFVEIESGEDVETQSGEDVETQCGEDAETQSREDVNFGWIRSP